MFCRNEEVISLPTAGYGNHKRFQLFLDPMRNRHDARKECGFGLLVALCSSWTWKSFMASHAMDMRKDALISLTSQLDQIWSSFCVSTSRSWWPVKRIHEGTRGWKQGSSYTQISPDIIIHTSICAANLPNEMFANYCVTIVQLQAVAFSGTIWMPNPQQKWIPYTCLWMLERWIST